MTHCVEHSQGGNKQVYAVVKRGGVNIGLHRLVYCEANNVTLEEIKGLVVRHKCDNRRCINPDHLEIGTHKDNTQDARKRGRLNTPRGDRCTWAKVPTELRAAIRGRVEAGEKPSAIAAELGISRSTVSYHIHGRKK